VTDDLFVDLRCVIVTGSISVHIKTRHRANSLTFRVTTPPQYGRNGTAHSAGASILSPARGVFAGVRIVCVCSMRAVGLPDYRWALQRISMVLP